MAEYIKPSGAKKLSAGKAVIPSGLGALPKGARLNSYPCIYQSPMWEKPPGHDHEARIANGLPFRRAVTPGEEALSDLSAPKIIEAIVGAHIQAPSEIG